MSPPRTSPGRWTEDKLEAVEIMRSIRRVRVDKYFSKTQGSTSSGGRLLSRTVRPNNKPMPSAIESSSLPLLLTSEKSPEDDGEESPVASSTDGRIGDDGDDSSDVSGVVTIKRTELKVLKEQIFSLGAQVESLPSEWDETPPRQSHLKKGELPKHRLSRPHQARGSQTRDPPVAVT